MTASLILPNEIGQLKIFYDIKQLIELGNFSEKY